MLFWLLLERLTVKVRGKWHAGNRKADEEDFGG
jgi:hypothetical protein